MANTKAVTKATTKVLGFFRKGSALGDLAQILSDRKPHRLGQTLAMIRKRHKTAKVWRGYGVLRTVGKTRKAFSIKVDRSSDTIQLTGGRRFRPKKVAKKTSQPSPPTPQVSTAA